MDKRKLGNSDLLLSPLGLGAWAMGGSGWLLSWGEQDDAESIATICRAVDLGINWIDTAPAYGLGHSEEIVGKALSKLADKPYVFTKCSLVWDKSGHLSNCLKASSIRREVEESLRRLRVEAIDLYQIHWPLPDKDIEEGWATLADLRREGKVRYIGVSNFSVEQMKRVQSIAAITSLQPQYSLVHREAEGEILPYAEKHNIGVIGWSPLKSGLLSGRMSDQRVAALPDDDWRKTDPHFCEPWLSYYLGLVEVLKKIGSSHQLSAAAIAIAWTLRMPAVTGAIVGARSPSQIETLAGAAALRLNSDEVLEIEAYFQNTPRPGHEIVAESVFP